MKYLNPIVLLLLISGCKTNDFVYTETYVGPDRVVVSRMKDFLQYTGFAIKRPEDVNWFSYHTQQSPEKAHFIYDNESSGVRIDAYVTINPIGSLENGINNVNYISEVLGSNLMFNEIEFLSIKTCKLDGLDAVCYNVYIYEDASSQDIPQRKMFGKGVLAVHPTLKNAESLNPGVINAVLVSAADLAGKSEIESIKKNFIDSIVIQSAPGVRWE